MAFVVAGVLAGCRPGGDGGPVAVRADEVGADPFTADVASETPTELVELVAELRTAAADAEA